MLIDKLYKILGYAGAVPFLVCGLYLLKLSQVEAASNAAFYNVRFIVALTQLAYAGFIASFLAGIHWAHALPRGNYIQALLAMIPSVTALGLLIFALISGAAAWPLCISALGFAALFLMDKKYLEAAWLPTDYFAFRRNITIIASASLFASAASFWI